MKKILIAVCLWFGIQSNADAQTSNWTFLGPNLFPTNISGQINGIGRVCQIKYDPNDSSTLYACSASGGFWKSLNDGMTWSNMGTDMLPKMGTSSTCIDHTNSDIIYLSSGDPNYYGVDFGIWKTTNGGNSWAQSNTGIGNRMALEILMDPADHLVLIAATNDGIWKTTDGGANWIQTLAGNQFTDMKWQPLAGSQILYASSMNKFFRSTDKGSNWTEITNGFNNLLANGTRLAISEANPDLVYVGTIFDEGTIFRSTDAGLSFTIQYHVPLRSLTGYDTTGGGQGNYNFCLEANPQNPDQLMLGSHNIWRSNDAGITWVKLTNWWQTVHTDMHDYVFKPGSSDLFQANDGGVWMTPDFGVSWEQRSDQLGATENYHAATSPLYQGLISTGTQDNGELVYIDQEWKTNRGGDWTTRMQMDFSPQKFVYYFDDLERRALPSGGGKAYNLPTGISSTNIKQAFSADDQEVAFVAGSNVWRTQNLTSTSPVWTQIVTGSPAIKSIVTCKGRPNIMAYSVSNKIFITYNALSASPSFVNYTFPITGSATDIAISPKDSNLIYVILNNKVYRSVNGGVLFTDFTGTLPNQSHLKLFYNEYANDNSIYVGNKLGIWYRNDNLSDWVNYSGALPTIASIEDVMYFNDGGVDARLIVSYYGRGTWQTDIENTHSCATPGITTSQWVGNNFQMGWNNTGAPQYQVAYRELGTINWMIQNTTTANAVISNYTGCASYEARVRALCNNDTSLWSNRVFFSTPSNALNNDFQTSTDIGAVGAPGSVCYDAINQRYTIYAAGDDIWDKQDEFHYLYRRMVGDVTISARVKHIGNIYGWAKGGIMIRETLSPDSKHAMCVMTPGNGFAMQWRTNTNDWSDNTDTAGSAPGWVKLERIDSTFTSYFSLDGLNWNTLQTATISMTDTVFVGLSNCSHIDATINEVVIDHIVINGVALSTTSVEKENAPFVIYPNPAQESITLKLNASAAQQTMPVELYDLNGKLMKHQLLRSGQQQLSINISSLSPGTYIVKVSGPQVWATTILKQ
ncbi:MAG: T9SS type A sorting domain-containing protein [Chitinophagaceae bacterium]|nr:T9SS type A sorting domain-containing protein [Chitinophagaceae bacterium]